MTKKRIKQICLILVCVIALGAVVGALAPKLSLSGAINLKRAEKLSLKDYTLVDSVSFPATLDTAIWKEYTREAHSTEVLDDGYRITCNLSTTELYDNGTKKGDYGLSHQTESAFYPYHNFVSTFQLRGMSGDKTLDSKYGIVFRVPEELNYNSKDIYYCEILHVHNDGWVYGMDESSQETKLFQLKFDEYTELAVKYAADGTIDVYRRDKRIYSTRVNSQLFEHGDLLGVQRAFYFFTKDGVDSNVGASIDLQDLCIYALSEEYDSVNK